MIHADLRNRHYVDWIKFLRESEGWSKEQIAAHQLSEVRRVVTHAYGKTVGYRNLYDQAGVNPDSIRTLEDLCKFPFVEKEMIRDALDDFSVPMEGRTYITTGGSTGIPTGMYRDPVSFGRELASKAYQYYRVGWKEGDRQIVFRGLRIKTPDHTEFVPEFNELRCSTYNFTPEIMETYRRKAFDYKPEWIRCYPSSGYIFACFLKEAKRDFPLIKGILCSSEHLYDFQKKAMNEVFQRRIFIHYGHYEMAILAGYCEYADTYHVLPQYGYAELLGSDGQPVTEQGRVGEIVGTSFIMHATPFVRYRTQDLAVFKGWGCPSCGRPYQIWDRIEGRLQEFVVTRSGHYLSTSMLNMHDDFYDHIKQFQFHQHQVGKVTFSFVPKESCTAEIEQYMLSRLVERFGGEIDLEMKRVLEIPLTPRGKHRLLVQELALKYDNESLVKSLDL